MNKDPLITRIGTFLIMLGIGALILFITSDLANTPDFDFLFVSLILLVVGWMFQRRRAPPPPSGRFSILRRRRNNQVEKSNPAEREDGES
ncbi:MAG: hypothetical protein A2Y54_01230 [Chloroflexi bacterium RBG_16_51_16]|nr:MAG: hypothetical protein A2Y54_01230 [Chloroflexi bacterium RBG_16_51_16]